MKNAKYNAALMSYIGEKQKKLQRGSARDWWYKGSILRKTVAVIYEIAFYLTLAVNFIIISGYSMRIDRLSGATGVAQERLILNTSLRAFLFGSVILVLAYIVRKLFLHTKPESVTERKWLVVAYVALTVLAVAILFTAAFSALVTGNTDNIYAESLESTVSTLAVVKLVALHIAPLAIQLAAAVMYTVFNAKCDGEKKAMYKKIADNQFSEFIRQNPSYTQEQWEAYLNGYAIQKREKDFV